MPGKLGYEFVEPVISVVESPDGNRVYQPIVVKVRVQFTGPDNDEHAYIREKDFFPDM